MPTPTIRIQNLIKTFGTQKVLNDVSLDIPTGESFVLLGRSGSGKSVLLKCLLGLLQPDHGTACLQGLHLAHADERAQSDLMQTVGVVFQGSALFDSLPVWYNVCFAQLRPPYGLSESSAQEKAKQLLHAVNLPVETMHKYPAELSGGMQRRVALARAIARRPNVLLLDEPTAGLDPIFSQKIAQLIQTLRTQLQATVLTITHDLALARTIADRIGVLNEGKVSETGDFKAMQASCDPAIHAIMQFA